MNELSKLPVVILLNKEGHVIVNTSEDDSTKKSEMLAPHSTPEFENSRLINVSLSEIKEIIDNDFGHWKLEQSSLVYCANVEQSNKKCRTWKDGKKLESLVTSVSNIEEKDTKEMRLHLHSPTHLKMCTKILKEGTKAGPVNLSQPHPPRPYVMKDSQTPIEWYLNFTSPHMGVLVHSPGFVADFSMFNSEYFFDMGMQMGSISCWKDKDIQVIDAPVLLINGWSSDAFQHFAIEVVPRLALVYDWLMLPQHKHIKIVSSASRCVCVSLFVHYRVLPHTGWCVTTKFTYYSDVMITPYFLSLNNPRSFKLFPRGILGPIQHLLTNGRRDVDRDTVLYLSRHGSSQRNVKNHNNVVAVIERWTQEKNNNPKQTKPLKFVEFVVQNKPFDYDRDIVSRSLFIIGPHGGKFANLIFACPNTYVLEFSDVFIKTERFRSDYYALAQAASLHYWYLIPDNFTSYFNFSMTINIQTLKDVLDQMYSDMANNYPHLLQRS
ncbi:hypothetical protein RFI_12879 [Reticulomyxa filosa]|uniref:Glycosyltransferase 61 catalytic domain-containing protein n=1 Tax=Reticulomyxa filosa TaxID=46433 RepID=X6NEG0_RETFI|nr:hypothetical protein RFI_12879 [Reticulomyxa filosa]|eukprot:ETO24278.1 hypothetical protein RFI_12879 [Reticulomyxa filosa]